jgi:DNA-binding NarL/FixJ family response regulator
MYKPTCILIDDEQPAIDRIESLLNMINQVEIIARETTPEQAMESIKKYRPDILFLDVEMPRLSGFDIVKQTRSYIYNPTYIFVTAYNQYAIKAIKAEAFDFLIKPVDVDELKECIYRYFNKINQIPELENFNLTPREKEIALLVARGKTSHEIAEILNISKHTVDTHRRNMMKK